MLSIGLSVLAMYLVYQFISTKDAELERLYGIQNSSKMVVAKRDIMQFETIRPSDIDTISVPFDAIPPGMLTDPTDVIDAVAAIPLTKGEHILDNKIISKNIYSGLDTQVAQSRRAISIPVNTKSSIGFMLRPGNRVDLAAHFIYKEGGADIEETKIFMQDLLVLASGRTIQSKTPRGVDQALLSQIAADQKTTVDNRRSDVQETLDFVKTDSNFQTVTLEVTAEQAQKIVYVMGVYGDSITLLLRHSDDRQLSSTGTTNFADVMGEDSYYVRGDKQQAPRALPRPKFFDYLGDTRVPIY